MQNLITEITAEMEILPLGSDRPELAEKLGAKEAARRTQIGYPFELVGLTIEEKIVDRDAYRMNPDGTTTDYKSSVQQSLYHPVLRAG